MYLVSSTSIGICSNAFSVCTMCCVFIYYMVLCVTCFVKKFSRDKGFAAAAAAAASYDDAAARCGSDRCMKAKEQGHTNV